MLLLCYHDTEHKYVYYLKSYTVYDHNFNVFLGNRRRKGNSVTKTQKIIVYILLLFYDSVQGPRVKTNVLSQINFNHNYYLANQFFNMTRFYELSRKSSNYNNNIIITVSFCNIT